MNYLLTAFYRAILLIFVFLTFLFSEKVHSQTCNSWLNVPTQPSWVNIGDVDVTGDKITVEALINIKGFAPGGSILGLDVVSKHTSFTNVNYLLRASHAELTTTNGYFFTPYGCDMEMNKTYHVAMVYDGATLKYYRNGFLMGETPATGNMIQSDLPTAIGFISTLIQPENFIGFINEVRIWNVARTQGQIRAFMGISLPNPTTQTGLVSYHTFNNLLNKQGNPAWNGTLVGAAAINQTNPECTFVADTCAVPPPCKQTLSVPTTTSKVRVGDVDIAGNKLTVEATFNRTSPVNPGVGGYGFLVSKHTGPPNTNYALWPNGCAITTSVSGHHVITENCEIELNKTYHVAMVYDGATLKFYRNGFLQSQTPASGNLVLNDLITTIGQNVAEGAPTIYPFIGYIDEVRIWNVAKTQQQIRANMDATLPNPATQPGLVAYYTFDNLTNKQGNPAWNGTSVGGAVANKANPQCDFTADSCAVPSPCDKALHLPTQGSKVTIGDVDVTGNKLTVEAMFNRNVPLNNGIYYGHLVSKHTDQTNVNYALLPNGCEITTSGSGYKAIFQDCPLVIGKTYHVAMVYDGATLKFYRNGILLSQTACTGNVVNNNLLTTIGQVARGDDPFDNQFLGYTNEVRIWKEARTQTQLQTYMNQGLPNPATQAGLVAYYSFNNLDNKQGNAAFNGTIRSSAAIGKKNPDCSFVPSACNTLTEVTPAFIIPDTVCVNTPVNISNISMNATNYYWNFCVADINKTPTGTNLGNINGMFSQPVYMDYVFYNNNYYGFLINHYPGKLVRLNFGNSLLNTPTATDLGNFGGIIPPGYGSEGIQVVQNEGKWYAIIVGGYTPSGSTPRILKISFGADPLNPAPIATNWGNIGNMLQPLDLHVFKENNNWYGLTVNGENNTITRFSFTNSFENTPTAVNLGDFGMLDYPTSIYAINDNGFWRAFVTNSRSSSRLVRLDFGSSLLNAPTAVNLGSIANTDGLRDITIIKSCDQTTGFAVHGSTNELYRLNFSNLATAPTITNLGNVGNLSTPHSISKLFRVNDGLYSFITNVGNNTITRLRFEGCTNSNPPGSTLQNPPPVTYSAPGIYNVNLTVDDGLPTQSSICKQIVVKDCTVPSVPDFDIPDTVCVGTPVVISNTSVNATSYYWNFCTGDIKKTPEGTNLGNVGGILQKPVFMDYVNYNGNYYGFLINHDPGKLIRLNFGNSLLNVPTTTDLGNFGGLIPRLSEGIQVVYNEGKWYAIVVAGYTANGVTPRILKVEFGPDLTNTTPVVTNWGNLGNMEQPIDLHVFQDNGNWYGFTVNAENNTITRFNFTNSFNNTPTAVNLGNIGGLAYPDGIYVIKDNNSWKAFITNGGDFTQTGGVWSLTRLDFGTSLLNTPTGVNLGNAGGVLKHPRDLTIMKFCGDIIGFAVNGAFGSNDIVKIDFHNDLNSIPTLSSLGNTGNLNFPVSITKIFREGADLFSFVLNAANNTITRLRFAGCTNSDIPNSSLQNPPDIVYNTPGTYNINLTTDDGLPTQSSICKQVVVLPALEHKPTQNISICQGGSVKLGSSSTLGEYLWNTGATTDSIIVTTSGIYWVETNRYGCINRDSFNVAIATPPNINLGNDTTVCSFDNFVLDAGIDNVTYLWNDGSTSRTLAITAPGKYYVTITQNSCEYSDTINVFASGANTFDFTYRQQVCDPLTLVFQANGSTNIGFYWNFGDGTIINGGNSISHTYTTTGNYLVKYSPSGNVCKDTVIKLISVNIVKDNIILTNDTTICYGTTAQLRTIPSLDFCWSPVTYLNNPKSQSPIASPPQDITYYYTAEVTGTNVVVNGDFSQGNTGFTSGYNFAASNTTNGQYAVGANPQTWNGSLSNCKDHTSGSGNMMLVKSSLATDVNVWKQTVTVTPNTNYAFVTWIQRLHSTNPGNLYFSINGKELNAFFIPTSPACAWGRYYITWHSGSTTTAVLSIVNRNPVTQDGYFALDDISLAPVFIKRDSINIKVEKPVVKSNNDTIVCAGSPVQLNTGGAQNYVWSPAAGLSNTAIRNPVASPIVSTEYIVTGTTVNGCSAKDTVNVNVYTKPAMTISNDTIICSNSSAQLIVTGGAAYEWSPAATLNNPNIYNPVAAPAIDTRYYIAITDVNNCEYLDSTDVAIRPPAVFSINAPQQVCLKDSMQLTASGGDIYAWQPAQGLNNSGIANPLASPSATTEYTVTITEKACNESETLSTRLTVIPSPVVTATRSNDIDCSNDRSQLNATGADQYTWTPATTLSNQNIRNPVATPVATTEYIVKGISLAGCKGFDTIVVKVDNVNKGGYEMPNAFTPNYDGKNDCYGIKYWGIISELEFSVYNRWGERIFFTRNAGQCWDGTYKGVEQDGGVYVYMIKAKTSCEAEVFRKGTFVLVR